MDDDVVYRRKRRQEEEKEEEEGDHIFGRYTEEHTLGDTTYGKEKEYVGMRYVLTTGGGKRQYICLEEEKRVSRIS
ncbi:hypothetical protein B9Z55_016820 [Caenorhabditis nigoni]|uniref:Uncharacterized protein n=1 Tax=Caenorhabditis nigoni TaxID=1611254 RepID=A0A2G5T6Y6_9PELO|nr:hypothetical protein B9Z55_016820 [Caenorhabditis nigoni]